MDFKHFRPLVSGNGLMALNIKIIQHSEFLEVIVAGTYHTLDAIDRFPHVLSTCRLTGLTKVPIDFRSLAGIPAATEKITYAFEIQDSYVNYISTGGREIVVAYVGSAPLVSL
jgi:hypothetical protein